MSSDESEPEGLTLRKNKARVMYSHFDSDSDEAKSQAEDSDSSIEVSAKRCTIPTLSDSESSNSDSQPDNRDKSLKWPQCSSSDSDEQSENCPICLAKFKNQEIGLPNSCEHSFCFECILEWSRNVTTCPIDRKQFQFILAKEHVDGCVIRQVAAQVIEQPAEEVNENEIFDTTFCEICGASDREDRMLLCDGCDLGYHLECLVPPLESVPTGAWHCPECTTEDIYQDYNVYVNELELLFDDIRDLTLPGSSRRTIRNNNSIIPRTRQSDRIRARIISNRQQSQINAVVGDHDIEVCVNEPSTSGIRTTVRRKRKIKGRRRKCSKSSRRVKITCATGKKTRQEIIIQTRSIRKKKKKSCKKTPVKKSAKGRIADQLGICVPKRPGQSLPEMHTVSGSGDLSSLRRQAGIPSLNLFGTGLHLDFFSGSDADNEDGEETSVLTRRAHPSGASIMNRLARRKNAILSSSANCDILGGIMQSQELMLSRDSVMSVGTDGSLLIKSSKIDVKNSSDFKTKQTPSSGSFTNSSSEEPQYGNTQNNQATISNNSVSTSSEGSSSNNSSNASQSYGNNINNDLETVTTSKTEDFESSNTPEPKPKKNNVGRSSDIQTANDLHASHEEDVSSTTEPPTEFGKESDDDDECPNASIYSKETLHLAKSRNLLQDEVGSSVNDATANGSKTNTKDSVALYSDSDEEVVKGEHGQSFDDLRNLTEDISEDERSYTPCLDERPPEFSEALLTEAISEDEKNDFVDSKEVKVGSEADALEINPKDTELDFAKHDEYEEGEIVDKNKKDLGKVKTKAARKQIVFEENAETPKDNNSGGSQKEPIFKKISKSNKDRQYRDKSKKSTRSVSRERDKHKSDKNDRSSKKEKRKELERYNVRNVVADRPRRSLKDRFGRDARRRSSSRSSSASPVRAASRERRSYSREYKRKKGSVSKSRSRSRRRSPPRRKRTPSKSRRNRSAEKRRRRSSSRQRSSSPSGLKHHRMWNRRSREKVWNSSMSLSKSPERRLSPSWTPPRRMETTNPSGMKGGNLTVILSNDSTKKKRERKRLEKRKRDGTSEKSKKRKKDRTPVPSKEIFASGDNILVSVSFNKENDDTSNKRSKKDESRRSKKERQKPVKEVTPSPKASIKQKKDLSSINNLKPIAIIDLNKSPFKELTPSPKDIIVLSDSDNGEEGNDSNKQDYEATGPKTPPEPQIKFSLNAKGSQLRAITNPLQDPDEDKEAAEIDAQVELEQRLTESLHKGPNTPPEPPESAPSSPDVYDPFDPTKSRSPTPSENSGKEFGGKASVSQNSNETMENQHQVSEENNKAVSNETPNELPQSTTPPLISSIQPADSQTNVANNTAGEEELLSSEKHLPCSQASGGQSPIFSSKTKSSSASELPPLLQQTITTSSKISTIISTPVVPASQNSQAIQRTSSGNSLASKSSPQKPMLKILPTKKVASNYKTQEGMELDSPYSPGPSDYEDLFEPPAEKTPKPKNPPPTKAAKKQNTFDLLFGSSSPINKSSKPSSSEKKSYPGPMTKSRSNKQVGIKIDEDCLKILDDLPNSAVEMQVKDKFLKKLNRQERVVEEVKLVLKPHYNKKRISKEEYKDILRKAVPKICHSKSGEINPKKIQNLIEAYVKKVRHSKKVTSSSSVNVQK